MRPLIMPSRLSRLDDAETLRGLVRDLREGIYVTDRDGRVLDANRAFLAMFGASSLDELAASIQQRGLLQPIKVVPRPQQASDFFDIGLVFEHVADHDAIKLQIQVIHLVILIRDTASGDGIFVGKGDQAAV